MNKYAHLALKVARALYFRNLHIGALPKSGFPFDVAAAGKIDALLALGKPCMVARFGATEMRSLSQYYVNKKKRYPLLSYIRGRAPLYVKWAEEDHMPLSIFSGFFPSGNSELVARFCELMLEDIPQLDILGSWLKYEELFDHMHHALKVNLIDLEPYNHESLAWTRRLAGKKVLVIHPFAKTIRRQYEEKRTLLFRNPDVLPEFELDVIPAVQSLGGEAPEGMATWFDALDYMKAQMDARDYDVCLIGCGAYGFPLAAHAKRQGKQGVHLGGALQLLFGIKGKRWTEQYGTDAQKNPYLKLFNEHWVFADGSEKPKIAGVIEDACYW